MAPYRHILVPTDGSPLSTKATKEAIRLARAGRARITALHVIPPFAPPVYIEGPVPPELYSPMDYKRSTQRSAGRMLAKIERLAAAAKVRCDTVSVEDDPPWKAIIRVAKSRRCDVIVMASHGRRGIAGLLLGSETLRVLTHTRIPVLVCR